MVALAARLVGRIIHHAPYQRNPAPVVIPCRNCNSNRPVRCLGSIQTEDSEKWKTLWWEFMRKLHQRGYFSERDEVSTVNLPLIIEQEPAAVKRALLNFARNEDLLLSGALLKRDLKQCVAAGLPPDATERKARNALKRLRASVLDGQDLPIGEGGAASFQDVCRLWLATAFSKDVPADCTNSLSSLLPQVISTLESSQTLPGQDVGMTSQSGDPNRSFAGAKNMQQKKCTSVRTTERRPRRRRRGLIEGNQQTQKPWSKAPWNTRDSMPERSE